MSNSHSRVLILGGGLSGLAAAHRLQESAPGELEVRVLEASPHLGGVIRTDHIDDMLLEMGPDSMITEKPWALDLCRRLGIDQDLIPTQTRFRKTLVVRDGALLPLPEAFQMLAPAKILPFLRSPILSIPGRLRALLDIVIPRGGPPPGGDETLGSFVRRRFGKEMLQRMAQPLVGGIYTADPEKLSLATTLPRFLDLERNHRSVILGLRRQASQPTTQAASGARFNLFQAPRGGMGSLVDRLVEQLPAETIQRQTRATGIRREEDWVVTTTEGEWRADGLIVALPAPRAAEVLDEMDPALAADLASIPYASTAVAGLAYKRTDLARDPDFFGIIIPATEGSGIVAISVPSVKFEHRAPDDMVTLRVFLGGALAPTLLQKSDEELLSIAHTEVQNLLGARGEPVLQRLARWNESMPQYHAGHTLKVLGIEEKDARHEKFALAGNAYHGVGLPDAVHSGEQAADSLLARGITGRIIARKDDAR